MSAEDDFDPSAFADIPDPVAPAAAGAVPPARAGSVGPSRAALAKRRALFFALGAAWTAAVIVLLGVRHRFDTMRVVHHIAIPLVLGVAALAVAFSPGRLGLGPSRRRTMILAVAAPILFVAAAWMVHGPLPPGDVPRSIPGCGGYELLAGVVPVALAAAALRGTSVANSAWRSALVASGIGLVVAGLWAIHCADGSTVHVVLAHGLPVFGLAAVGGLVMGRIVRVR